MGRTYMNMSPALYFKKGLNDDVMKTPSYK
jgi:hypothetical protein